MNAEENNIPGLYLHIPFCDGKCSYCAFYSIKYSKKLATNYLSALECEMNNFAPLMPKTIYIGGGTPSILLVGQLERLCESIHRHVCMNSLKEWSVEINPGTISSDKLQVLLEAGVNRISMGAQSFNEHVLQWLGRRHTVSDTLEAVDIIRNAGVTNLSLDLIACVPNLSGSDWANTIQQALALGPEHLSIYALTDEEGTELRQSVLNGKFKMLKEDEQLQALELAEDILTASGYARYEISNYAKSGLECRHHISCWRGEQYIGLGPAAASHIGIKRRVNKPDLFLYIEAIQNGQVPPYYEEVLSADVERLDQIIFGLRMAEGISTELAFNYQDTFQALQAESLVVRQDNRWKLTNKGRNVADAVALELMSN